MASLFPASDERISQVSNGHISETQRANISNIFTIPPLESNLFLNTIDSQNSHFRTHVH